MFIIEREEQIMSELVRAGSAGVRELATLCGVTEVTIRRDLKRLEEKRLLRRTHGGAVSQSLKPTPTIPNEQRQSDALILAPIQNIAAHALKERALRNKILLLAESSEQDQALYLGPDNSSVAEELGRWTAQQLVSLQRVSVLDVSAPLANTKARSIGFLKGLRTHGGAVSVVSVNGEGLYEESYHRAKDALGLHPDINVIFGVNDDAVLGALQAYQDLGRNPNSVVAVNVGGEGDTILDALNRQGPLKATMALFPELVGRLAIDTLVKLWAGADQETFYTPTALIDARFLSSYYERRNGTWELKNPDVSPFNRPTSSMVQESQGKRISFVIQYRTHEWYQNLAKAMQTQATRYGLAFEAIDVNDDFAAEIRDLRRLIGKLAASYVNDGETIILDAGSTTKSMAQFLHSKRCLTVVTNSLDVFKELQGNPSINLKLTGGDFYAPAQSFVGRGAQLFLSELRADKAFLVAAGVSASFGISSAEASEAEVRRAMVHAAREVVLLADHTVVDTDSNFRVVPLDHAHTVITDAGLHLSQSHELAQLGLKVITAGRVALTLQNQTESPLVLERRRTT